MKNFRLLSTLSAVLLAAATAPLAQPPVPENRITVTGMGEIRVAPDRAVLIVEASNNDNSPLDAAEDTQKDMGIILVAARQVVQKAGDLRTTRLSINPEYEWVEGKRKFRGYNATQSLEITLQDPSKIESLLEGMLKAPISTLGNLEFRHSQADSLNREATVLAMRDAGVNARTLCEAVKRSCEELLAARMTGFGGTGPRPMMEYKAMRADAGGANVQPGVLSFTASVEADYRLKPEAPVLKKSAPAPVKATPAPVPAPPVVPNADSTSQAPGKDPAPAEAETKTKAGE